MKCLRREAERKKEREGDRRRHVTDNTASRKLIQPYDVYPALTVTVTSPCGLLPVVDHCLICSHLWRTVGHEPQSTTFISSLEGFYVRPAARHPASTQTRLTREVNSEKRDGNIAPKGIASLEQCWQETWHQWTRNHKLTVTS